MKAALHQVHQVRLRSVASDDSVNDFEGTLPSGVHTEMYGPTKRAGDSVSHHDYETAVPRRSRLTRTISRSRISRGDARTSLDHATYVQIDLTSIKRTIALQSRA